MQVTIYDANAQPHTCEDEDVAEMIKYGGYFATYEDATTSQRKKREAEAKAAEVKQAAPVPAVEVPAVKTESKG